MAAAVLHSSCGAKPKHSPNPFITRAPAATLLLLQRSPDERFPGVQSWWSATISFNVLFLVERTTSPRPLPRVPRPGLVTNSLTHSLSPLSDHSVSALAQLFLASRRLALWVKKKLSYPLLGAAGCLCLRSNVEMSIINVSERLKVALQLHYILQN